MSARRRYATLLLVICQLTCWPVARMLHSATCPDHACVSGVCAGEVCASADTAVCRCGRHGTGGSDGVEGDKSDAGVAVRVVLSGAPSKRPMERAVPHTRGSCAVCVELAKSSCLPPVFSPAEIVLPDSPVSQVIFRIPELAARMRFPARGPPV